MLKASSFHIPNHLKKLADKFLGPYEVLTQAGTHRYPFGSQTAFGQSTGIPCLMLETPPLIAIPDRVQTYPRLCYVDDEPEFKIEPRWESKVDHRV